MGEGLEDAVLDELFPKWVFWVGVGIAAATIALMVLWYVQHPDQSPFEQFDRRMVSPPQTNGNSVHPAPEASLEVIEGDAESA